MLSLHTENESGEGELDVKSLLGSGWLQTQVLTDNQPLWFSGSKDSLWWYKVKGSPSFICFRWRGSRHRVFWPWGASGHSCAVWIASLVRTHLWSQTSTITVHSSWKVAFTWLPLLLCSAILSHGTISTDSHSTDMFQSQKEYNTRNAGGEHRRWLEVSAPSSTGELAS